MDNRPMTQEEQAAFADGSMAEAHRLMMEVYRTRAGAEYMGAPLYHGCVIRDAFLAGVKWERERVARAKETEQP